MTVVKEDRTYTFTLPDGAPLGEAYDATVQFLNKVSEKAKEFADSAQPKDGAETVAPEVAAEVVNS